MKREIKFRAWDNHGTMREVWGLDKYSLYFDEGPPEDGIYGVAPTSTRDARSAWVLMQYTGLQDKNGVDIYEGDKVRHVRGLQFPDDYHSSEPNPANGTYTRIGHITITTSNGVTLNGRLTFEPECSDDGGGKTERKYNENPGCWSQFAEVIGHKYENPKLISEVATDED